MWVLVFGIFMFSWSKSELVVALTFVLITYVVLNEETQKNIDIPNEYVKWIRNLKNAKTADEMKRTKIQLKDMLQNDDFLKDETENEDLRKIVNHIIKKYDTTKEVPFESNIEVYNPHSIATGFHKN
jgi:hypothetical protein